ncbi:MBOAT family O-acyltransferase [Vibrio barjaei]|uniref:MBOAT family O-acyltransferase n=1 Tax=Vibrio barjaei TaxID=1676683 RepID=UPI000B2B3B33|nr:MBOAT family O-acyltransferase [Vibrio barjaei]
MLFSSWQFIFLFLLISFVIYFTLLKYEKYTEGKVWLVITSLFFYGYWKVSYLSIIVISMLVNYFLGSMLFRMKDDIESSKRKAVFCVGIAFNLILLCYYKYTNFLINNVNYIFNLEWSVDYIILPLAISFFTFQQIAYLVDCNKGEAKEYNFLNYSLFVTFFPQLIAGPIVHHKEMMVQFESKHNLKPS